MLRNSFISVLLVLLLIVSISLAGTIHVPGDYATIQEGLDAASIADTVLVAPGTYVENLIWPATNGIKLVGEMGAPLTVINGDNQGRVISIETDVDTSTVITGFSIQNGSGSAGAGIHCSGASPCIINNIITDNDAGTSQGGGVGYTGASCVVVQNNQFLYNSSGGGMLGGGGGGLNVWFSYYNPPEFVVISGNTFIGNTSFGFSDYGHGGGMFLGGDGGAEIQISSNEFLGNSAHHGGGLYLGVPNCYVTGCNFEGNSSTWSGGVSIASSVVMSLCTITGNSGLVGGISVRYSNGDLTMDSCTVANNIGDGIRSFNQSCSANYCNIFGNSEYGAFTDNGTIDATYCWWGDPSGPGGVGPGTGDEVSSNVLYDPWLTELGIQEGISSVNLELSVNPNPFTASSTISFNTHASGNAVLQVFDLSGRLVETLVAGDLQEGFHSIGITSDGYSPGVYLIHLQFNSTIQTERCVVLR